MGPRLEIGTWIESLVDYLIVHLGPVLDAMSAIIESAEKTVSLFFVSTPPWIVVVTIIAISLWAANWKAALFTLLGLALISNMGLWTETMDTLSLMTTGVLGALLVGIPIGIMAAENRWINAAITPVLDFSQTLHPFVYLVPVVFAFGIGVVPAILATVLYTTPISIRLTNLGVRQVPIEVIEAGKAFGCTRLQLLRKVKLPTASKSILAGINQTVMMSLGFVVIAALIGAQGLGGEIVTGITRLDLPVGFEAGIAVVIVAIILDRIGRGLGERVFAGGGKRVTPEHPNSLLFWTSRWPRRAKQPIAHTEGGAAKMAEHP